MGHLKHSWATGFGNICSTPASRYPPAKTWRNICSVCEIRVRLLPTHFDKDLWSYNDFQMFTTSKQEKPNVVLTGSVYIMI